MFLETVFMTGSPSQAEFIVAKLRSEGVDSFRYLLDHPLWCFESFGMGTAENELTVSTTEMTSGNSFKTFMISSSGFIIPQEVSLCTRVTMSNSPEESWLRRSSGSMFFPHSTCKPSADFPHLAVD